MASSAMGVLDEVETADPITNRIRAFGASAIESNGHELDALDEAMTMETGKPHFVIARTDPVRGLPLFGDRAPLLHYLRFTSPEERAPVPGRIRRDGELTWKS
jgi:transketolase